MAKKVIAEQEARIYRQIDAWDHKLSSSPIDKVMVAKIMCLSIALYHAGIAPGWSNSCRIKPTLYCKIPSRQLLTGMQSPKGPRSCYGNPGWITHKL
jgi:hypothetical protein